MAENSKIEWTRHTFNPWIGCQKVGPGCDHCYAEAMMADRYGRVEWGPHGARQRTSPANWRRPLVWDRAAAKAGERHRVFCASLADVFDNHASVDPQWRRDLWALIAATPHLDWMLLTKRPGNIDGMLPHGWGSGWPNVWIGCTVVNQAEADRDIPKLLAVPAAVRFLSAEPLLGPVNLRNIRGRLPWMPPDHDQFDALHPRLPSRLDLVIVGGESGPGARPMNLAWARSLRDQCVGAGVAFFLKQWGEWGPLDTTLERKGLITRSTPRAQWHDAYGLVTDTGAAEDPLTFFSEDRVYRVGKRAAGRLLDGRTWDQMPARAGGE